MPWLIVADQPWDNQRETIPWGEKDNDPQPKEHLVQELDGDLSDSR